MQGDTILLECLKEEILMGKEINREEAILLSKEPLEELCHAANEVREHFCGNAFDMCTIVNGKSGKCSENCKYCAQSAWYATGADEYPLMGTEELIKHAQYNQDRGVLRYSIVTSGKRLSSSDVDRVCQSVKELKKKVNINVCASFGLLDTEDFEKMKDAGVTRVHNNLETSERYFSQVCTTHTYQNKVDVIRKAQAAGLKVCSGGIMGMGETMEDRIDMALYIRSLGVKSIPVNFLNPIEGTPFASLVVLSEEEMRRIVALFRMIIPNAAIRLAGGRGLMKDKGRACFQSGANAAISGDMLTTAGITIEKDRAMVQELGYFIQEIE